MQPPLSGQLLELLVQQKAREFSRDRKLGRFTSEYIDSIPSTPQEMLNDLLDARAFLVLNILDQEMRLADIDPGAYYLLEGVWLRRVKQMKAFHIWKVGGTGSRDGDFHQASREIREWLLKRGRSDLSSFNKVRTYLRDSYLDDSDALDERKLGVSRLITAKARRLWEMTGETREKVNWFRAKLYVTMFYENIIGAVVAGDLQKTAMILKAFEFSKFPRNRYLLTNGFEGAVAIEFLDKDVIRAILEKPSLFNFNMVPVRGWPEPVNGRSRCGGRFRYDDNDEQIIYEGVMDVQERDTLLAELDTEEHRIAVEHLFEQSELQPFREMIL